MNRRQKIIVSVVGIFIVLLALVGITYGYFLTRIQGNTNTTSITVTTADLKLVYGDGNGNVSPSGVIMPDNNNFITFSNNTDTKTFIVTNDGNATVEDYVVVVEDVSVTYASNATLEDGTPVTQGQTTSFNRPQDFVYVLSCKAYSGYGTAEQTELSDGCNGIENETVLPMLQDSILVTNTIEEDITHAYELKIKYLNPDIDQSKDMNKTFSMKVNIYNFSNYNPYSDNTDSLAYNILNNSMNLTTEENSNGYAKLVVSPPSKVAVESSTSNWDEAIEEIIYLEVKEMYYYGKSPNIIVDCDMDGDCSGVTYVTDNTTCNDLINKYVYANNGTVLQTYYIEDCVNDKPVIKKVKYEKVLSISEDDYGTSYYYRGNVKNNYLNFNKMCWRIVRIEGDGSIKLILEDQLKTCQTSTYNWSIGESMYGYNTLNSYGYANYSSDSGMGKAFEKWLTDSAFDNTKLKKDKWCLGNLINSYSSDGSLLSDTEKESIKNMYGEFYYDVARRIQGRGTEAYATFKCNEENYKIFESYISTLTADEVVFAGESVTQDSYNHYLVDSYSNLMKYENGNNLEWLTISISQGSFDSTTDRVFTSSLSNTNVQVSDSYYKLRPSITLKANTLVTEGVGTKEYPYEVE